MGDRRATSHDEKEVRRQRMIDAAGELLQSWSLTEITMDRIAHTAGVAKGTLYLYYRTRETLLLALYERLLASWYTELEELARQASGTVEPAIAARVIASTLGGRPTLIQLHGLVYSTLGRNIDPEAMLQFRRRQRLRITSLASTLSVRIANLSGVRAARFLMRIEVLVGGLSWAAFPSPVLRRAMDENDLAMFRIDFEEELSEIITALLQ